MSFLFRNFTLAVLLLLAVLQGSYSIAASREDCVREAYEQALKKLLDDPKVKKTTETDQAKIAKDLAASSGLKSTTIQAIQKNFHEGLVTDGSTGVFKHQDELYLKSDANLIAAYKVAQERLHPGAITVDDINAIRENAITLLSVNNGRHLVEPKLREKLGASVANVRGNLHPEVSELLKEYGITGRSDGKTIKITHSDHPELAMQKMVNKINRLYDEHAPPEQIVSAAMQDFLIIHPYKDGNGRTARIFGQALYEKLTGKTVIFPEEFHAELDHSPHEMARALADKAQVLEDRRAGEPISNYTSAVFKKTDSLPTIMKDQPAAHNPGDVAFWPEVKIQTKTFKYADIPPAIRQFKDPVYYGRPAKSLEDAERNMKTLFQFGRNNRGSAHLDLEKHAMSTQTEASGFFPTSVSSRVAEGFAMNKQGVGVVYFIDPRGAEVLNLTDFVATVGSGGGYFGEKEILFPAKLSPDRVIGGVIGHFEKGKFVPDKTVFNPNYQKKVAPPAHQ